MTSSIKVMTASQLQQQAPVVLGRILSHLYTSHRTQPRRHQTVVVACVVVESSLSSSSRWLDRRRRVFNSATSRTMTPCWRTEGFAEIRRLTGALHCSHYTLLSRRYWCYTGRIHDGRRIEWVHKIIIPTTWRSILHTATTFILWKRR